MKQYERLTDRDITKETKQKLCIVLCDIRRRCLNPDYKYFYLYGERGISVCEEWLGKDGQKNFREWAVNNGYEKGLTIDRIDNNKGYSPDNCRWVTAKEQSYNRRSNKLITIHGKTQTVTEWAKETGIPIGTLQNRLRYGWEEDRLLEPKQVHLKMSKHEMRVEILKLRKQLKEYQSKIEAGTLVAVPYAIGQEVYWVDKKGYFDVEKVKVSLITIRHDGSVDIRLNHYNDDGSYSSCFKYDPKYYELFDNEVDAKKRLEEIRNETKSIDTSDD